MKVSILPALFIGLATAACSGGEAAQPTDTNSATASTSKESAEKTMTKVTDVTIDEASSLIASDPALVVLDVRTPKEFDEGHIAGAINVDFLADDFAQRVAELDTGAHYLLHCKSGKRSTGALEVMEKEGFTNIAHMNGGFDAWKAAGQPVEQ